MTAETAAHEKNNTSAALVPFTFLAHRESDTIVGASKADITRSTETPPIAANSPHVILVSKTTFHTILSAFMIVSSSYRCECSDSTICQGYGPELRCKYTTAPLPLSRTFSIRRFSASPVQVAMVDHAGCCYHVSDEHCSKRA